MMDITKDTPIPDLIRAHPATRAVFDRHGLKGCGGREGPQETLEFFSRAHRVPLDGLLVELESVKNLPVAAEDEYREDLGDVIYRRFFTGALLVLLIAGLGLGLMAVFIYAARHSLNPLDRFALVQAHGDLQIFGFIGLFVMGFACQALPRFKYLSLHRPPLAAAAFVIVVAGLVLRTAGGFQGGFALAAGTAGGILTAAGVTIFAYVMARTLRASTTPEPFDRWIVAGLAAFLLAAWVSPFVEFHILGAAGAAAQIERMALWLGPTRDLQIFGFVLVMALGVSQRVLPAAFGFREIPARLSTWTLVAILAGLLVHIGAGMAFRLAGAPVLTGVAAGGLGLVALAALALAFGFRAFTGGQRERSRPFVRSAWVWLAVGCALVLVEPFYTRALGFRYAHGFQGALRHAFGLGFASLLIVGVSAKVAPILRGVPLEGLPRLLVPLVLLNAAVALRVGGAIAAEVGVNAGFTLMAAGGVAAWIGFLAFALHLLPLIHRGVAPVEPSAAPTVIDGNHTPATVVRFYPETLEVFESFGLGALRNPILRGTMGRRVTLRTAAAMKGIDLPRLLEALNARAATPRRIEV